MPTTHPTLRQRFVSATATALAGALLVGAIGAIVLLRTAETPTHASVRIVLLLIVDVAVFIAIGRYLLKRRILDPLDQLVEGVEAIASGDYSDQLPQGETHEVTRVNKAVNNMAERLIEHRELLAENVRSLEETNRELTETRDELIRVERVASVGRLAAGIAHQVGNPLTAVIGYLDLLQREADGEAIVLLASAEREARRIDRIVRGLLDYARPRDTRTSLIHAAQPLDHVVELLSTQGKLQDVHLVREFDAELPLIEADPFHLEQVFINLLLNALDSLQGTEDATLSIQAMRRRIPSESYHRLARRRDDPPDVDYSHRRRFHDRPRVPDPNRFSSGADVVEIRFVDNGPGVPEELVETIFEPFVSSKEPNRGTGLGLAVAASLIDAMGGTIYTEETAESGAVFTVALPAAHTGAPQPS